MVIYSKVTEAPDYTQVVTLTEAKAHLRVTGTNDDAYITTLINVAGNICESYSGLSFTEQVRQIKLDKFPCDNKPIIVPYGPVVSIDEFNYVAEEDTVAVSFSDYREDLHSPLARLLPDDSWPSVADVPNAVTIEYTAGYETVPGVIKQAMLLQIGTLYENRQDEITGTIVSTINWASKTLLDTVKVYWHAEQD